MYPQSPFKASHFTRRPSWSPQAAVLYESRTCVYFEGLREIIKHCKVMQRKILSIHFPLCGPSPLPSSSAGVLQLMSVWGLNRTNRRSAKLCTLSIFPSLWNICSICATVTNTASRCLRMSCARSSGSSTAVINHVLLGCNGTKGVEQLSVVRHLYYENLYERVKNLSVQMVIAKVGRWCCRNYHRYWGLLQALKTKSFYWSFSICSVGVVISPPMI